MWLVSQFFQTVALAVDVFFSVHQVKETVFITVALVDIFEFGVGAQHELFVGKEHQAFFACEVESRAQHSENLTDCKCFGHHKPARLDEMR